MAEVEAKMGESETEYKRLLDSFDLVFEESFLAMSEAEIAKLLQRKKESSLKVQIEDSMSRKWQLKQALKRTERDIKVR